MIQFTEFGIESLNLVNLEKGKFQSLVFIVTREKTNKGRLTNIVQNQPREY